MKRILVVGAFFVLCMSAGIAQVSACDVTLAMSANDVLVGEDIVFTLSNATSSTLSLPSPAPWQIEKLKGGKVVFLPVTSGNVVPLPAGSSQTWDVSPTMLGKSLPQGQYLVRLWYYDAAWTRHELTANFTVGK